MFALGLGKRLPDGSSTLLATQETSAVPSSAPCSLFRFFTLVSATGPSTPPEAPALAGHLLQIPQGTFTRLSHPTGSKPAPEDSQQALSQRLLPASS